MLVRHFAMLAMLLLVPVTDPTRLSAAEPGSGSKELRLEVEKLAVDYRIAIYSAYRTDRQQYEGYRQAWAEVQSAWVASGQREADLPALATWLRTSIDQVRESSSTAPPATPTFGTVDFVAQSSANAATNDVDASVPTPNERDRVRKAELSKTQHTAMPRSFDERVRRGWLDRSKETLAERNPPLRARALAPSRRQLDDVDFAAPISHQASNPCRALDHIAFRPQVIDVFSVDNDGTELEPNGKFAEMSAVDDKRVLSRVPQAKINVQELIARSAGYNLGMQALRARFQSQQDWSARELAALMIELEDLVSRREDLSPYYSLLGDRTLTPLTSPEPVLERIQAQVVATRKALDADSGSNDRRQHDLELLDVLQQRLKELAQ